MTTHLRDEIASFHSVCEQSLSTFRGWITGHEAHLAVFHRTSDPVLADDIIKRADSRAAFAIAADAANLLMLVLGSDLHKQGFNLEALHPDVQEGFVRFSWRCGKAAIWSRTRPRWPMYTQPPNSLRFGRTSEMRTWSRCWRWRGQGWRQSGRPDRWTTKGPGLVSVAGLYRVR